MIRIVIDRFNRNGENKKYQSTPEEVERNQRENAAQQRRDELARLQALRNRNSSANRNSNGTSQHG